MGLSSGLGVTVRALMYLLDERLEAVVVYEPHSKVRLVPELIGDLVRVTVWVRVRVREG